MLFIFDIINFLIFETQYKFKKNHNILETILKRVYVYISINSKTQQTIKIIKNPAVDSVHLLHTHSQTQIARLK